MQAGRPHRNCHRTRRTGSIKGIEGLPSVLPRRLSDLCTRAFALLRCCGLNAPGRSAIATGGRQGGARRGAAIEALDAVRRAFRRGGAFDRFRCCSFVERCDTVIERHPSPGHTNHTKGHSSGASPCVEQRDDFAAQFVVVAEPSVTGWPSPRDFEALRVRPASRRCSRDRLRRRAPSAPGGRASRRPPPRSRFARGSRERRTSSGAR